MNVSNVRRRGAEIPNTLETSLVGKMARWETLLVCVVLLVFFLNTLASPYFLDVWNLSDATYNFIEKSIIAFAVALVIISGEIDLSVAANIALSSTMMGAVATAGFGTPVIIAAGLLTSLGCGAFNGFLVAKIGLHSIIVTIATMSLFRGISYIILGDTVYKNYPESFAWFGQGYLFGAFTVEMIFFLIIGLFFWVLLHKTTFGRNIFVIGNNKTCAAFSGIKVSQVKFNLFLLSGLASGIAAVLLTSRLGSTRPSIAQGWELEIVTMVVLGGVNILGGSGTILGVTLAALLMGLVTFGLGLLNVPGIVMTIFTGCLLIGVIVLPRITKFIMAQMALR
ncbi:ABC transporter permease [Pseudovibrio sp. Tun.PSC04-5.I4]|uniref:ABC transporter permease n=1 Tax=Pseudovibrio sp. Tun.PSC04-5.I4 TaxID=1798213 RepID=UPI0008881EE9|nr:ABC transporter permease [Pseudovibrio sp. Tun.PSC04-5.I4]SDQ13065.1 monosaccharide ABC transporter membrane protein, CUT2 family [Pseudovibrio sp. Tun.PSC04-5.I4]